MGARVDDFTMIGQHTHVGPDVVVGKHCKIQNACQLFEGVFIGNSVFVGPGVIFTNVKVPWCDEQGHKEKIMVEHFASIGAGAIIMPGIKIGRRALVGAGAVVTRDVPANTVVVGNPAKFHAFIADKYTLYTPLKLEEDGLL
jgi:acetyltransferase-like isoleucine patch superfamily enzyme